MNKSIKTSIALALSASITGCGAIHTSIAKRNLEVSTQASESIFLDPVSPSKRTVYLHVRNTSDQEINISSEIKSKVESRGYRVTNDPSKAQYWLQANILKVSKGTPQDVKKALNTKYGGALGGAVIGGAIGAGFGGWSGVGIGGLAGAAAGALGETLGDAMVQDVVYYVVTDVQIAEKTNRNVSRIRQQRHKQGQGGSTSQNTRSSINRIYYQTRIVSSANKMNLQFSEASGHLEDGLSRSIAGFF